MLAAFNVFLSRLCGQEDIIIGLPAAGQATAGWNELVGHCVNLLPLRSQPCGEQRFTDYLIQLRAIILDAYDHQQVTFGKLLPALKISRDPGRIPLVAAIFNINMGFDLQGMKFGEHEVNFYTNPREYENFELHLSISPAKQGGFVLEWTFNTALFSPTGIQQRIAEFETLLRGISRNPDELIYKLPLLPPQELETLLHTWNNTDKAYPEQKTLHQLCEEQAARTPHLPALLYENEALTYQELNSRANQLAHYLRKKVPKQGDIIALCMERSPAMIIAMLAILKAGKAYVPLDPAYPADRINFMLADSQASYICTCQKDKQPLISGLVKSLPTATWLDLNELAPELDLEDKTNLSPAAGPADLAYLFYTSGSTGRPKGVAIEHHSPVAFITWAQSVYSPEELKGVLASTSICFDLSIFEIFVTLATGGCIILAKNLLDLPYLKNREQITLINTVPSVMASVLPLGPLPASVQTVNLCGEPLSAALVDKIYAAGAVSKVYDLYGPSESTTYSTYTLRQPQGPEHIGRPIANTKAYILDKYLQPVPIGIKGELCLSGAGLARGYLNRPELTAEKFIPNPFLADGTARLYRTGDLVRYLEDGRIEYSGRLDNQIKLRGYRIELNEIAATIMEFKKHLKGLQNQIVVIKEITPQDKQIVAYLVVDVTHRNTFPLADLRDYLQKKLPAYMVPSYFVLLDKLPLTPNGKIDRRLLPAPERNGPGPDAAARPKNKHEEAMAALWSQVLGIKNPGVTVNFFELGGHSLLATQLVSLINQTYGLELPLSALFLKPTISELTIYVAAQKYTQAQKDDLNYTREREIVEF
jgi:amino acid adenylation domain-containing protein